MPLVCDFCNREDPRVTYETAKLAIQPIPNAIGFGFDERWAACAECAKHIDRRDMKGLIARVAASMLSDFPSPDLQEIVKRDFLEPVYMGFFAMLSSARRMCLEEAEREPRPLSFGPPDDDTIFLTPERR